MGFLEAKQIGMQRAKQIGAQLSKQIGMQWATATNCKQLNGTHSMVGAASKSHWLPICTPTLPCTSVGCLRPISLIQEHS